MKRITEADIAGAEAQYGITFTPEERTLLTASKSLLGHLEQQRAYLLVMALAPIACPACSTVTCQRAAALEDWETCPDDQYACHACHMPLIWLLLFTGQQLFMINQERQHLQHEIASRRALLAAESNANCPGTGQRWSMRDGWPACPSCGASPGFLMANRALPETAPSHKEGLR